MRQHLSCIGDRIHRHLHSHRDPFRLARHLLPHSEAQTVLPDRPIRRHVSLPDPYLPRWHVLVIGGGAVLSGRTRSERPRLGLPRALRGNRSSLVPHSDVHRRHHTIHSSRSRCTNHMDAPDRTTHSADPHARRNHTMATLHRQPHAPHSHTRRRQRRWHHSAIDARHSHSG